MTIQSACQLVGVARATWYRRQNPPTPTIEPIPQAQRTQPAALTAAERNQIEGYLVDEAYADLSVSQVFYRLLDEGVFIASESSWHRIARSRKLTGDRRRQATHRSKAIPELAATGPNQVWSWDITVLPSIDRGRNFRLFVILDVFSRAVVGWRLEDRESVVAAVQMLQDTITAQGQAPEVLHADRGSPMTGHTMTAYLAARGIVQSHSRPHVSNDNPFSEAQFKTMKYDLDYPRRFTDLTHARTWVSGFIHSYNTLHRHSGIGYYTPQSVHDGTWTTLRNRRQELLDHAWRQHPKRFCRRPRAHIISDTTWINKPTQPVSSPMSHTG